MLDLVERVREGTGCEVAYLFLDTGLEYAATKAHLDYLEGRYGIRIERRRAEKSIPTCVREFGQPFMSKFDSEMIEQLQKRGFAWEDEPYDVLSERYPRCDRALKWWTNGYTRFGRPGWYDIGRHRLLKEFMVQSPPTFKISNKCCDYAKKRMAKRVNAELGADVDMVGVRKAEEGVRMFNKAYNEACLTRGKDGVDHYRPIFWMSDRDKAQYVSLFGVRMSDCYTVWGFTRTGCVGCPFGSRSRGQLDVARRYEPGVVAAVERVFAESYEYRRRYEDFKRQAMGQMPLF